MYKCSKLLTETEEVGGITADPSCLLRTIVAGGPESVVHAAAACAVNSQSRALSSCW